MITNEDAADLLGGLDLGSTVAELDNLLETARVETSVFDDLLADRVDLIPGGIRKDSPLSNVRRFSSSNDVDEQKNNHSPRRSATPRYCVSGL